MKLRGLVSKSIRIPRKMQAVVGKEIVRLTLNPVLYERSRRYVRWTKDGTGPIHPREILLRAREEYPQLSLSAAVEGVLVDLIDTEGQQFARLSPEEQGYLKRFSRLSLAEKLRIAENWKDTYRYLLGLSWKSHEARKGIRSH